MHYLLLALCFCLNLGLSAQESRIISRSFLGLERTKERTVARLTQQAIGVAPVHQVLEGDIRRLKNFVGIIDASYQLDTLAEGIHLTYHLREGTSRYPIAKLGGLQDNFWWEAGYADQNWQGKGETVSFLIRQIDGRFGGKFYYYKPSISNSKWGLSAQLERYASQEPLYFEEETVDYAYENLNAGLSVIYQFRPEENLQAGFTYFREDYAKVDPEQISGPAARREIKKLYRLGYQLNQIHPDQLQPAGYNLKASSELVFQASEDIPFYLLRASYTRFLPSGKSSLFAGRLSLGYSANKNTPFAPFVVDSRINIRGSGNRVDRGTAAIILNLEYRQLLWQKPTFALQAVLFTDLGSWRSPGGEIADLTNFDNAKYFTGAGLRFLSSGRGQLALRIDYGYGLHPIGRRGIVLGLGQYF